MKGSYIADAIDLEYQKSKRMKKRLFVKRKCMNCKNLNTPLCNIIETPEGQLKCNGFMEVWK